MSEPTRPVPTQIGPDGNVTARVTMSPTANNVRAEVHAPPDHAIPIIFVPGIMGSPLLATGLTLASWATTIDGRGFPTISRAGWLGSRNGKAIPVCRQ